MTETAKERDRERKGRKTDIKIKCEKDIAAKGKAKRKKTR